MAGRGPQSFKKRQKEQARKEKQEEKRAKRLERKRNPNSGEPEEDSVEGQAGLGESQTEEAVETPEGAV
jgi:hypothetical protein